MSSIVIAGDSSGSVTLQAPSVAGSTVVNLPSTSMNMGTGGGNVATNTAFGASAMANMTSSGFYDVAVGYNALYTSTSGIANNAIGYRAMYATTTGANSQALGASALAANTTGSFLVAVGDSALAANTTGNNSIAIGQSALAANTTASNNTAVGYQAGYSNTTGTALVAIGNAALDACTTGNRNTAVGDNSLGALTTGDNNTSIGRSSGLALTTGVNNTFVGAYNGSTGGSGELITTGSKNTILGSYNGNQGGLDIRTSNNYIVLSDGDGNPYGQCNASFWKFGIGGTGAAYGGGSLSLNGSTASGYQTTIGGYGNGTAYWTVGTKGAIDGSASTFLQCQNTGGGVYLNGASATSWTAVSDERLKENLVDITDAAAKVSTLRAVVGNYTWDEEKARKPFLIAQDVQAVLPEAVSASRQIKGDETEYLGVSYTEVIPLLVAAIKEQQAIITTLTERITALEAK